MNTQLPKTIPMHQLKSRVSTGIEMKYFEMDDLPADKETFGAHRDDHYLFFLLDSGSASLMIDFNELLFVGQTLFYILPGQVHHRIRNDAAGGWYLAVDPSLVPAEYRDVFENKLLLQQPVNLTNEQFDKASQLIGLLNYNFRESTADAFHLPVTYSLLQAFIGIVAGHYAKKDDTDAKAPRSAQLARQFKALLAANYTTHKSPSAYADLMNVTEGYLNEVLKKITGSSVSRLINHEIMLEAKRLLYYSRANVKKIAHTLGYQDHTYFSRFFKKAEGITPLEFRARYLK